MNKLYLITSLSLSLLLSNCTVIGITVSHITNSSYYEEVLLTQESLESLSRDTYVKIYLDSEKVHKGQFYKLDTFDIDNASKFHKDPESLLKKSYYENWQITIRDNKRYYKYLESEVKRVDKFNKDDNTLIPVIVGISLDLAVLIYYSYSVIKQ